HQRVHVGVDRDGVANAAARLGHVAYGDAADLDAPARATGDFFGIAGQHAPGSAPHHAQPEQADLDGPDLDARAGGAVGRRTCKIRHFRFPDTAEVSASVA